MECSPSGSSVHRIYPGKILEWVSISFSRGSLQPRQRTHISCISCLGRQVLLPLVTPRKPIKTLTSQWHEHVLFVFRVMWFTKHCLKSQPFSKITNLISHFLWWHLRKCNLEVWNSLIFPLTNLLLKVPNFYFLHFNKKNIYTLIPKEIMFLSISVLSLIFCLLWMVFIFLTISLTSCIFTHLFSS